MCNAQIPGGVGDYGSVAKAAGGRVDELGAHHS